MARSRFLTGVAAALIVALVFTACTDDKDVVRVNPVDPLFQTYVSLGNSITAGFQSAGINDSTQRQSYAVLFAQQAGTRFAIPSLQKPGCPPPIDNFATQHRVGDGTSTTCLLRTVGSVTAVINNVAVPGATSFSPAGPVVSADTVAQNALTTFILGGETQVQRAVAARPTFVSVWIGNNDVLGTALTGIVLAPGGELLVPDSATFASNLDDILDGLAAAGTIKGGVLFGVVNVSNAPLFFPAAALFNQQVKAGFDAAAGTVTTIDPNTCSPTTQSLINFAITAAIRAGTHPATVFCSPVSPPPLGDAFVLDANDLTQLGGRIAEYNEIIKERAQSLGWAYVDVNPSLVQLKLGGEIPLFPNLLDPTHAFGDFVSLDGIHPAAAAHQLIANLMIDSVNAKFGTSVPNLP